MTIATDQYNAASSQFERDTILNDMTIEEFAFLVHETEERLKNNCKKFKNGKQLNGLFAFKDMRLLQREYGIDVRATKFELKVGEYKFEIEFEGALGCCDERPTVMDK